MDISIAFIEIATTLISFSEDTYTQNRGVFRILSVI